MAHVLQYCWKHIWWVKESHLFDIFLKFISALETAKDTKPLSSTNSNSGFHVCYSFSYTNCHVCNFKQPYCLFEDVIITVLFWVLLKQKYVHIESYNITSCWPELGTVENHRNTEITETVIFIKGRDFARMPCFAVFFAEMPGFTFFYKNTLFLISISWSLLYDFITKIITFVFASATKVRVLC